MISGSMIQMNPSKLYKRPLSKTTQEFCSNFGDFQYCLLQTSTWFAIKEAYTLLSLLPQIAGMFAVKLTGILTNLVLLDFASINQDLVQFTVSNRWKRVQVKFTKLMAKFTYYQGLWFRRLLVIFTGVFSAKPQRIFAAIL